MVCNMGIFSGPVLNHQIIQQQQQQQPQIRMSGMTIGPQGGQIAHGQIGNVTMNSQGVMGQGIGPQGNIVQQGPMSQVKQLFPFHYTHPSFMFDNC